MVLLLSSGAADAEDRALASASASESPAERWVYSETVSPFDYAPVVIASAWSSDGPDGAALQFSIQCRRGRTDLVITGSGLAGRPEEQRITWTVDARPPVALSAGAGPTGTGLSIKDDAVRLLAALPPTGELALQVTTSQPPSLRGRYAIAPLKAVLGRMAAPCKWPPNAHDLPATARSQ
jgi:hypothetical protein